MYACMYCVEQLHGGFVNGNRVMYVCMCVCMYVYMYYVVNSCMHARVCAHWYLHTKQQVAQSVCCAHMIHAYAHIHTYTNTRVLNSLHKYTRTCIHTYIYQHLIPETLCMYACTNTHTHTHTHSWVLVKHSGSTTVKWDAAQRDLHTTVWHLIWTWGTPPQLHARLTTGTPVR
jgi:hypothetical protein